MTPLNMVYCEQ